MTAAVPVLLSPPDQSGSLLILRRTLSHPVTGEGQVVGFCLAKHLAGEGRQAQRRDVLDRIPRDWQIS